MLPFWPSVILLAAALLWPASNLIWVLSVRRIERRTARTLSRAERAGQRRRAWLLAAAVVLPFSWLFNLSLLGDG